MSGGADDVLEFRAKVVIDGRRIWVFLPKTRLDEALARLRYVKQVEWGRGELGPAGRASQAFLP